ncbi:hypothetical protein GCM10009839_56910 [Catenulispora yoronensis]|uniref:Uncharacterized protein n=1 Tax=Catenulispora yoronensis TaxID=450799 RepID=A0ABP5GFD2_9ACTN
MNTLASTRNPKAIVALVVAVVAVLAVAVVGFAGCGGSSAKAPGSAQGSSSAQSPAKSSAGVRPADPAAKPPGMPTIAVSALPAEAREVLRRIDAGGPFKYRQDGVTFENREGLLPAQPRGYYREYTVSTPGAPDRGARRLILGRQGELYYTPDHYRSFYWVVRGDAT